MLYRFVYNGVGESFANSIFKFNPFIIGGAIAGGASLLSSFINSQSQKSFNREQYEKQNELINKGYAREDKINANSALIQRQALEKAGLNPFLSNYGDINTNIDTSVPALSAPQYDLSGLLQVAQMVQQQPLLDAQARQVNADAKAQEIENSRLISEDYEYYNDSIIKNPPLDGSIPELKKSPVNKGTYDALRAINQYKGELSDVDAKTAQNALAKNIAELQNADKDVVNALVRMPYREFRKLFYETQDIIEDMNLKKAQISLADSQTALNKLDEELKRNSNVHALITKYLGEGATADFAHVMVILLGALAK